MRQTLRQVGDDLLHMADPRALTGEHPWIALGTAAALGFATASAATPSREESLKHRLQSLFPQTPPDQKPAAGEQASPARKPSRAWSALGPITGALKDALVAGISSAVSAKVQQPQPAPQQPVGSQMYS